jgi:hypothetical protein
MTGRNYFYLESCEGAADVGVAGAGAALVSVFELSEAGVVVAGIAGVAFVSAVGAGAGAALVSAAGAAGGAAFVAVVSVAGAASLPRLHPVKTSGRASTEIVRAKRDAEEVSFIGLFFDFWLVLPNGVP